MAYQNDVFISYKRGSINEQWLDEIFLPHFKHYLNAGLEEEPVIFVDRTSIIGGTQFDKAITKALANSKCMVSILSPSYFAKRSSWCVKEFMSMKHREEALGLQPDGMPPCLIWPVMIQHIERKPPIIHTIQLKDYSDFNYIGEGFKQSPGYYAFQSQLSEDCETIIKIITNAPAWKAEWESATWEGEIETRVTNYFNLHADPKQTTVPC